MCAIIGVICKNTEENISTIEKLFLESKIRGLHATGLSFIKKNSLLTIKEALPADVFISKYNFNDLFKEESVIKLIGHCRYSTSDIRYNQPISDKDLSIVHNGVVTQEPYEKWKDMFHYDCITQNDSELIFQYLKSGCIIEDINKTFTNISFSLLSLTKEGELIAKRNSLRPLWFVKRNENLFYASTCNILLRSGFKDCEIMKVESIDKIEKQNRHF